MTTTRRDRRELRSGRHGLNEAPKPPLASFFARSRACSAVPVAGSSVPAPATTTQVPSPAQRLIPVERAAVTRAEAAVAVKLPTVEGSPAPNLGPAPFVRPLRAHQVVGFLPYWDVGSFTPDYQSLTALAYWAVGLGTDGSLDQQGAGYSTLTSAALGLDISQAHAAGDRVLLTVFSQSPSVLHAVAAHPATAGPRLAGMSRLSSTLGPSTASISTSRATALRTEADSFVS